MSLTTLLDVPTALLASTLSGWRGTTAFRPAIRQPEQVLELYEFEGCPYCRLVGEALTEMDLDALIRPCPKDGKRFRPRAQKLGGKLQFPLLIDPNTGSQHYESADIVAYLAATYGGSVLGETGLLRQLRLGGGQLARAVRRGRGVRARPSRAPKQPLELYSFESSPFSRRVREVLSELELPYLLRNTGKALWQDLGPPSIRTRLFPDLPVAGRNRLRLQALTGRVQVPYLIDPNTDTAMYESTDIIAYLESRYAR
ncbi:MAG: glutathione S-transferase N-terminal domain-containing protein [Xanthomonadales bacterium]|jgi:glutathione S-transferase|nr:glutathione S-transferase N-terminal domain-containing protein [Xanthomonadales bacterium]